MSTSALNRMASVVVAVLCALPLAADTISTGFTQAPASFPAYAYDMKAGPDGNVWIADAFHNKVGVLAGGLVVNGSSTPTFTGFPTSGTPKDITSGPDGNLWFTEGRQIGRVTVQGTVTEFPAIAGVFDLRKIRSGHSTTRDSYPPNNFINIARQYAAGRGSILPTPDPVIVITPVHRGK